MLIVSVGTSKKRGKTITIDKVIDALRRRINYASSGLGSENLTALEAKQWLDTIVSNSHDVVDTLVKERDEARAEVERLRNNEGVPVPCPKCKSYDLACRYNMGNGGKYVVCENCGDYFCVECGANALEAWQAHAREVKN